MRLRFKLVLMFVIAFLATAGLLLAVFPPLADQVTRTQLFSMARTVGLYLVHNLEKLPFSGDAAAFEKEVDREFEFISELSADTGEFTVRKVILLAEDGKVEIGHPDAETGRDYSADADIREALAGQPLAVVIEPAKGPDGRPETDADIVAPIRLADGDYRAVEVKLDLSATMALLSARYRTIQYVVAGTILAAFALLSGLLLVGVGGSVIRPVLRVSEAMEAVGKGDLDTKLGWRRRDEVGAMAGRFDEMVLGLRERFELSRYVSRSTFGAVRERVKEGLGTEVRKRRLTVFFSDVRGFTAYSERRPPERVIEVLNRLLGLQEEIIAASGGEVDKYVGDETMAIFENPEDALRAALRIRREARRITVELDGLRLGFGLHVGELVEGDIGSPSMMDHTVIGDTVNTAARIQAASGPWQILVSEELAREDGVARAFEFEGELAISAKGKTHPLAVRCLMGEKGQATGA